MLSRGGHPAKHLTLGEGNGLLLPALAVAWGAGLGWWLFSGPGLMHLHPEVHRLAASTLHQAGCDRSIGHAVHTHGYVSLAELRTSAASAGAARSCALPITAPAHDGRSAVPPSNPAHAK